MLWEVFLFILSFIIFNLCDSWRHYLIKYLGPALFVMAWMVGVLANSIKVKNFFWLPTMFYFII